LGCLPAGLPLCLQDKPAQVGQACTSLWGTPYEAMLGRAPPIKDRVATELILMDEWVQELCIAQEEARDLISANIKSE